MLWLLASFADLKGVGICRLEGIAFAADPDFNMSESQLSGPGQRQVTGAEGCSTAGHFDVSPLLFLEKHINSNP